jgi:hypothetical protein
MNWKHSTHAPDYLEGRESSSSFARHVRTGAAASDFPRALRLNQAILNLPMGLDGSAVWTLGWA